MDIIGALNKEREYLSFRAKGEEPYHWVDAVKEFGFESLNEYFAAKKDYEFSQLEFKVIKTTPERAIDDAMATINTKKQAFLYAITNETLVWNGDGSQYNTDYCNECKIPVYPYLTNGGTIVSTPGDITIGISIFGNEEFRYDYFLKKLASIFKKYTTKNIYVDRNDVIVDGAKIVGSAGYNQNGIFMFVASISLSDKTELINCICQKHSTKQPGYIDFIDANTLIKEIKLWLKV